MKVPVLLALGSPAWEPSFVSAITRPDSGFAVLRRCSDVADLRAAVAGAAGGYAVVGSSLPRLDRSAVAHCREQGLLVVAVHDPDDLDAADRMLALGVDLVMEVDDDPSAALLRLSELVAHRRPRLVPVAAEPVAPRSRRLVAVWGPPGAPGRSTVALTLADECARAGVETLLVDADVSAPCLTALLGLCDDVPALSAAMRKAERGVLSPEQLAENVVRLAPRLRLLAGGADPAGPGSSRSTLGQLWRAAAELAAVTFVDVGSPVGEWAEPVLAQCEVLVAVGSADPLGLARLVTSLPHAVAAAPAAELDVVVNRVRRSAVGPNPEQAVRDALAEHGIDSPWLVPDDRAAFDAAVLAGRTIAEVAPSSGARKALAALAGAVVPAAALRSSAGGLLGRLSQLHAG